MLLIGRTSENVQIYRDKVILLLSELGFVINLKKSVMTTSHEMGLLGMVINSEDIIISLPDKKLQKVKLQYLDLYQSQSITFTIDESVRRSYVNNPGCPSSTTEQSFPPATSDSSPEKKRSPIWRI